jgi:hypothetical protein
MYSLAFQKDEILLPAATFDLNFAVSALLAEGILQINLTFEDSLTFNFPIQISHFPSRCRLADEKFRDAALVSRVKAIFGILPLFGLFSDDSN